MEIKYKDKLAVAISRQHAQNARIPLTENDMFCFDKANNIFSYSVVMLFKKDHHLLPLVNTLIRRIAEAGFILKWKTDTEYMKFKEDLQKDSNENAPLNLDHMIVSSLSETYFNRKLKKNALIFFIQGMFGLLGGGVLVSLVSFIGEWIFHFFTKKKKMNKIQKKKWATRIKRS